MKKHTKVKNSKVRVERELTEMRSFSQFRIRCKFKSKKQKDMYESIMSNRITFVNGSAGSGKTLVALMAGLECLSNRSVNQMILVKPVIEISSRSMGFLPGDITEKTTSHYHHFYDNMNKLIGAAATTELRLKSIVKEEFMNFLRGVTFGQNDEQGNPVGSYVILDEAQNTSVMEMKTFISRMSENSRLIIIGNSDQIDIRLSGGEKNGLDDAMERLAGLEGIGFVEFSDDDIVRDPFLIEIMKRYKNDIKQKI